MVVGNKKVWCGVLPLGLHFVRFLKQIFGYTSLQYTVDRLNLQLSTCMVCLYKYHNWVTNVFSLAFQQLKSIGSEICYIHLVLEICTMSLAFLKRH
jgi:hypothetical protein